MSLLYCCCVVVLVVIVLLCCICGGGPGSKLTGLNYVCRTFMTRGVHGKVYGLDLIRSTRKTIIEAARLGTTADSSPKERTLDTHATYMVNSC